MTATFILAFAQGAASATETADVLVDGFGNCYVWRPVLAIMILGTAFKHKHKMVKTLRLRKSLFYPSLYSEDAYETQHNCIIVVVNRGFAEEVWNAPDAGAKCYYYA